jgi:hypothetical protein
MAVGRHIPASVYYTNEFNATDSLTKDLIVYSTALLIDVGNNCKEDVVMFFESSNIPNLSGGFIVNWTGSFMKHQWEQRSNC